MDDPNILLTNDDGVDATGLAALRDALAAVGSVTVVAPADDQSGAGRVLSRSVAVREHDREGDYVIDGTPADCAVAGLRSLAPETDLVVAGCNRGANLGTAVLGRSGTVSAAVEAALLGVPAIAVSTYVPADLFETGAIDRQAYNAAVDAAAYLADCAGRTDVFERADYLNVNAPITTRCTGEMVVTRPSPVYRIDSERDGGTVTLTDRIWELMESGSTPDVPGTDRHAVVENQVSVSPLAAPHSTEIDPALEGLADSY